MGTPVHRPCSRCKARPDTLACERCIACVSAETCRTCNGEGYEHRGNVHHVCYSCNGTGVETPAPVEDRHDRLEVEALNDDRYGVAS